MKIAETRSKRGDASDGTGAGTTLGARLSRVDGVAKVRGAATYALEHRPANLAHAVLVQSVIAAGRVRDIDAATIVSSTPAQPIVKTRQKGRSRLDATAWTTQEDPRQVEGVRTSIASRW